MPASCGYAWSRELDVIIREEAAAAFVPLDLAYTYIAAESGFNPAAHALTDLEDSVGLLQLNRRGGQGEGYSVEQLLDPRFNLRVGFPPIALAYAGVWTAEISAYEFLYQVSVRSGHPGLVERGDPRIVRIFNIWACFHSGVGQIGPGGSPAAAFVPGPGQSLVQFAGSFTLLFLFPGGILRALTARQFGRYVWRKSIQRYTWRYYTDQFISSFDPRRLDPTRRYRWLYKGFLRLPPGHRQPRG